MLARILADVILAVAIVAGSCLYIFLDVIYQAMTDENANSSLLDSKEKWQKAIAIAEICVTFLFLGILYFFFAS